MAESTDPKTAAGHESTWGASSEAKAKWFDDNAENAETVRRATIAEADDATNHDPNA